MNRNRYRVIFNAARGLLIAVAETAPARNRKSSSAVAPAASTAPTLYLRDLRPLALAAHLVCGTLLALLLPAAAFAQIIADPSAPANQRPTVLSAGNGTPVVNIQTPNAAGLSHNTYRQLDGTNIVFNNSRTDTQSQLAGWVQGNPWLARGTARVILNEVNSNNPSYLNGALEVAGDRAQLIIANPSGITCNGCSFINANGATLTTGTPIINGGNLESYLVTRGTITVSGNGMDASQTPFTDLMARAVVVNAGIWANQLKITTGANQISADHSASTPTTGTGPAPAFAIDVAQLGGMYAGKITLVGSETGLGVRNAGQIGASAGEVIVTADGRLENIGGINASSHIAINAGGIDNSGTIYAQGNTQLASAGDISNTGVIAAQGDTTLTASGGNSRISSSQNALLAASLQADANGNYTLAGNGVLSLVATQAISALGQNLAAGDLNFSGSAIDLTGSQTRAANIMLSASQGDVSTAFSRIDVASVFSVHANANNAQKLDNRQGQITAGQLDLQLAHLDNTDGSITQTGNGDTTIALSASGAAKQILLGGSPSTSLFDNTRGYLGVNSQNFSIVASTFTNTAGQIQHAGVGALEISAPILLNNIGGSIRSRGATTLTVDDLNNQGGTIQTTGTETNLTLTVSGKIDNRNSGTLTSTGNTTLSANTLDNRQGVISATQALRIDTTQALNNNQGQLAANQAVTLSADSIDNLGGTIGSVHNQVTLTATTGSLNNNFGRIEAADHIAINAYGVDNSDGAITGSSLAIDTQRQALNNIRGALVTSGASATDSMHGVLDSQSGALNNDGGLIQAAGALTIDTHGQTLTNINAGSTGGIVGQSSVTLTSGELRNQAGYVGSGGVLKIDSSGNIDNTQGASLLSNDRLTLTGATLHNQGGQIQALGDIDITLSNTLDNTTVLLPSLIRSSQRLSVSAATINNLNTNSGSGSQGLEGDSIRLSANTIDNQQGAIRANQTLDIISAGSIDNTQGLISSAGKLSITDSQAALAPIPDTSNRSLSVINTGGTLIAGQQLSIDSATLTGDGKLLSQGDIDIRLTQNYTHAGELKATGSASLTTLATLNNAGVMSAGNTLTLRAATIDNQNGGDLSAHTVRLIATGNLTNRGVIDGVDTVIDTLALKNLGAGKIYGDTITINADSVENAAETVDEVTRPPVIASRGNLTITATTLSNRGGATIYADGTMNIGGKNNAPMTTLTNHQSLIEAAGNLNLNVHTLNNLGTAPSVTTTVLASDEIKYISTCSRFVIDSNPSCGRRPVINPAYPADLPLQTEANGDGGFNVLTYRYQYVYNAGTDNYTLYENHLNTDASITQQAIATTAAQYYGGGGYPIASPEAALAFFAKYPGVEDLHYHYYYYKGGENGDGVPAWMTNGIQDALQDTGHESEERGVRIKVQASEDQIAAGANQTAKPAIIRAGGNLTITANHNDSDSVTNQYSQITAGGDLTLITPTLTNTGLSLTRQVNVERFYERLNGEPWGAYASTSFITEVPVAAATITANGVLTVIAPTATNQTNTHAAGLPLGEQIIYTDASPGNLDYQRTVQAIASGLTAPAISTHTQATLTQAATGAGNANAQLHNPQSLERTTQVTGTDSNSGNITLTANPPTNLSALSLNSSLFNAAAPSNNYLIETDPRFANYRNWLSSDALLSALGIAPSAMQKRLGDGFIEQKLIREQIAQLTGKRFLDGYASDEAEYQALINNAVTVASAQQLVPGIALSASQMAALTSDIVWLVEKTVTLADGTSAQVLVPQIYVRLQPGDLDASGALLAGATTNLNISGDFTNSNATIAGRTVNLAATNINNLNGATIKGNQVNIAASNDLNNLGATIQAQRNLTATARRDLIIAGITHTTNVSGSDLGATWHVDGTHLTRTATVAVTGNTGDPTSGTMMLAAGRDLAANAAEIINTAPTSAGNPNAGSTTIAAGNDLTLGVITTSKNQNVAWDSPNAGSSGNWSKANEHTDIGSSVQSSGDLTLIAGNKLSAKAANVMAGTGINPNGGPGGTGALTAIAGNDITIESGEAYSRSEINLSSSKSGFMSSRSSSRYDLTEKTTALQSTFSGDTVNIQAGANRIAGQGNLTVTGSNIVATNATTLQANNDVTIQSATESSQEIHNKQSSSSGVFTGSGSITFGNRSLKTDEATTGTTTVKSTIGSSAGNISITAGNNYQQKASDVLAPAGDITIAAKNVTIAEAHDTATYQKDVDFKQSGLTIAVSSPVVSAIQSVEKISQAARQTENPRMKALATASAALSAKSAYDAVDAGQGSTINGKEGKIATGVDAKGNTISRDANAADKVGGINISISVGNSKSSSHETTVSSTAIGSTLQAGGNIAINATGAGTDSKLTIQGSDVKAGNSTTLTADNAINLVAAQSTAEQHSDNKSSSASIGIGFALGGSQNGFTFNAAASQARGNADGNDVIQRNTHVEGGNKVAINSGADTNIKGAVVTAPQVIANVGTNGSGNLNIESLQDTSKYDSKQSSSGLAVSLCIPPFCYGATSSGSLSLSKTTANSNYASVVEQSGIQAGDNGFQVSVAGNTGLKGAVIASANQAIVDNKNTLITQTLTTSDLQNHAEASASSSGINLSSDMLTQGKYGLAKAIISNAVTNASAEGVSAGATLSAVSAGTVIITDDAAQQALTGKDAATTVTALNRDTDHTHTAAQKLDVQAMQRQAEAERVIRQEAVKQLTTLTDESYRVMFKTKPGFYKVTCPPEENCLKNPNLAKTTLLQGTPSEIQEELAKADKGAVLAVNGIDNPLERAGALAMQNAELVTNADGLKEKPSVIYLMHYIPASNSISELFVAVYEKSMASAFGYTNQDYAYADALMARGDTETVSLGHSRGTIVQTNASTILTERGYTNSNLSVRGVGLAVSVQEFTNAAATVINNPESNKHITASYFADDPVAVVAGGNPGVLSLSEFWRMLMTTNSAHSCYGTGAAGCSQVETLTANGPANSVQNNSNLIRYEGGVQVDSNGNPITTPSGK